MNYLPTLSELDDVQIAEAARAAGEPSWLADRRAAAWRTFAESAPPFWKRTNLSQFAADDIAPPIGAQGTAVQWDESLAGQGVIFTTLAAAVRSQPELVERYLGTAIDANAHKFNALHAALWQDGVFLYVPKGVSIEMPLHAIFTLADGSHASFPHNLIVLEDGASATFIEEYSSPDAAEQALCNPATELFVGNGASLRFVTVQSWGANFYHIGAQRARVGDNASLEWVAVNLGGQVQHIEAETSLEGTGANVQWVAATLCEKTQNLVTAPWLRHVGTNTEGHMDFKTVVKDTGYAVFDGMIKIEKGSRGTISRLEEHALHLSKKARNDSIPGLMIDTNDVQRAGHASTSGQIDDEMLFYMQSRGIDRTEAVHMIITGFFEPVLDRIPLEALRERAAAIVEAKI
jgi:Fe-S cluster assembly protein SufD